MDHWLEGRRVAPPWALTMALLAALALFTWLAPEEQTPGSLIRVVFLHGALVRVGQLAFFVVSYLSARPKLTAVINLVIATIILGLVFSAGLALHPANPIGESNSAELRASYYLITGLMLLLAAQLARLLNRLSQP